MARRRLFPSLRAAITGGAEQLERVTERKVVSYGYASTTMAGAYGYEDRAAGWDMDTVVIDGYERSVWVYRCVETISGHASRLPFRIGRSLGGEDEEILEDHPLYKVLNRQANPLETGRAFRKRLSANILLSKRGAFVEVTRSRAGTITRLDLLPPERVIPVPDPHGDYVAHFQFTRRDGQMREIAPERIRWFREPHPTDPFCGTTPLDAAGMSVRLDQLSREYNIRFIEQDSRPSGVVGVDSDGLDDDDLDRIERKFQPGAQNAGKIAVIGTGPGGIKFVDVATRPKDMSYEAAARNAKMETLAAFGVPESVLGNAAERTYSNADQEEYNYWTMRQVPHNELIADAFTPDIDDGWDPYLDTSTVEALELPRRKAREEALKEYEQGLRSIDEYRPLACLDKVHTPQARALWISPSKAPLPTTPEDAAALGAGEAPPADGTAQTPPEDGGQPAIGGGTAAEAVQEALEAGGTPTGAGGSAAAAVAEAQTLPGTSPGAAGPAAAALAEAMATGGTGGQPGPAAAALADAMQTKSLPNTGFVFDGGADEVGRAEVAVTGVLDALLARQLGVLVARLHSPKFRRGTKFWQAAPVGLDPRVGDQVPDVARAVDADRWGGETVQALTPVVGPTATEAGLGVLQAFAGAKLLVGLTRRSPKLAAEAGRLATETELLALTLASEAMRGWLLQVETMLAAHAVTAETVDVLTGALTGLFEARARSFSAGLAGLVSQVAVVGARDVAARSLTSMGSGSSEADTSIQRTWVTQADTRVRDTHRDVAGTTLPVGDRFIVGGVSVRWPGDPFAPAEISRACRCRLVYQAVPGVRYLSSASVDRTGGD